MLLIQLGSAICFFTLYFLPAGFIACAFSARQSLIIPFTLIMTAVYTACYLLRKLPLPLRMAPLLLSAAAFILCGSLPEYILLIPPVILIAILQVTGKHFQDYYDFRLFLIRCIAVCVFSVILSLVFRVMADAAVTLLILYIASGILTLRMLRQDETVYSSPSFILFNSVSLGAFLLLSILIGNPATLKALATAIKWVFDALVYCVLSLFSGVWYLVKLLMEKKTPESIPPIGEGNDPGEMPTPVPEGPSRLPVMGDGDMTVPAIIVGAIVIALFILLIVIIIRNRTGKGASNEGSGSLERRERLRSIKANAGSAQAHYSKSAAGVRTLYRKLLKYFEKNRVSVRQSHTSLEILHITSSYVPYEPHDKLRAIYIKARYAKSYVPTEEERRIAKVAYEEIIDTKIIPFKETKQNS